MNNYQVEYNSKLQCYILHYAGESICISAKNIEEAHQKSEEIIATWVF